MRICLILASLACTGFLAAGEAGYTFGGPDTWPFEYPADWSKDGAVLDLRSMNEKVAGEKGCIKAGPDGDFLDGAGKPIRFWAINTKFDFDKDQDFAQSARFLAKMGVNLVRLHAAICPTDKQEKLEEVNQEEVTRIWKCVAAMKKAGIYCIISPFWKMNTPTKFGIDGYNGEEDWGVIFFNPKLQAAYKGWLTKLYGEKNQYTGNRLADEPAVAIIQAQNEDSLLFWTFSATKSPQLQLLGKQFAAWAIKKYGSLDKALADWGGQKVDGDNIAAGQLGLLMTFQINNAKSGQPGRTADQVAFMASVQHDHYADVLSHLRSLGCKQLTNASNWITSDAVRLNDAERWSYTAMDVIAVNKYYGGSHEGPNNGWRVDPGDTYTNSTAVHDLRGVPICLKQVKGRPMMVTESSWVNPNLWQSEGPVVMSALQSLTGLDCYFWFAQSATTYDSEMAISLPWFDVGGQKPASKWSCSIPAIMGSFPAAAVAFRQGHIKRAKPVVSEARSLDSLWQRELPIIAEDPSFDPNRQEGGEAQRAMSMLKLDKGVDPLAFFVGPVEVEYGGKGETKVESLSKYIDHEKKTVTSATGELKLDWGAGVFTVDAPKTKAVTGFLKAAGGTFTLGGTTITSTNQYASVMVTALDDQPLEKSKKVLVQVGTIARPTGWDSEDIGDGKFRIVRTGTKPWQVVKTAVTVTLANPTLAKATLLDVAGFATTTAVKVEKTATGVQVVLPENAMYVVLSEK